MRKTKYYCDHCGKEISLMSDYTDLTINLSHVGYTGIDLCVDCFEALDRLIDEFCEKRKDES